MPHTKSEPAILQSEAVAARHRPQTSPVSIECGRPTPNVYRHFRKEEHNERLNRRSTQQTPAGRFLFSFEKHVSPRAPGKPSLLQRPASLSGSNRKTGISPVGQLESPRSTPASTNCVLITRQSSFALKTLAVSSPALWRRCAPHIHVLRWKQSPRSDKRSHLIVKARDACFPSVYDAECRFLVR